ncbi:hypothetical protein UPYG_G00163720 [Umbra pygmaea]|uniref:C-type lectin domain-containing protein n=1 Tax=Umbra pygmaea TaxID=75934 RepID=A0ABD0X9Z9_UMBPY
MLERIYRKADRSEDDDHKAMKNMDSDTLYFSTQAVKPRKNIAGQDSVHLYRVTTACLGLLCVLLLAGLIGLLLYWKNEHAIYNNLNKEREQIQSSLIYLSQERDQLQTSYYNLTKERDQLQTRFHSLTNERDQLQRKTEMLTNRIKVRPCPEGWSKFEFSCYYITSVKKTWVESREDCNDRGADLVVINNLEEQLFVNRLSGSGSNIWIGLTGSDTKGTWTWVDDTPLTIKYWAPGQPNNDGEQECVEFIKSPDTGVWNDKKCDALNMWICEL